MSPTRLSNRFQSSHAARSAYILAAIDSLLAEDLIPAHRVQVRKIRQQIEDLSQDVAEEILVMTGNRFETLNRGESRVADLLTQGRLTREISKELHISEATVKTHLAAIYRKLEVRNRAEAIRALLT